MSGYEEFFKKKRDMGTARRKIFSPRKTKSRETNSWWLISIAFVLAGGSAWYLLGGEEQTAKILSRVEVSVFGSAQAEEKTADEAPKAEEKKSTDKQPESPADPKAAKAQPKTWTDEEIILLTKLEDRKKQLDQRETNLAHLEEELHKQRDEVEKRLAALEEVRGKIAAKLEDKVKVDQQKVDSLVSVYANMKPAVAAKVIESINEDLAVEVLAKMKNKAAAEILNLMDPDKAKKLSERFAGFRSLASDTTH